MTEELFLTIVAKINDVAIDSDGEYTINGETVTVTNFSLSTTDLAFQSCNLRAGNFTFSVSVGEGEEIVTASVNFGVVVDNGSCKEINDKNGSFGDGEYLIDPDGDGNAVLVHCDMCTGWNFMCGRGATFLSARFPSLP